MKDKDLRSLLGGFKQKFQALSSCDPIAHPYHNANMASARKEPFQFLLQLLHAGAHCKGYERIKPQHSWPSQKFLKKCCQLDVIGLI